MKTLRLSVLLCLALLFSVSAAFAQMVAPTPKVTEPESNIKSNSTEFIHPTSLPFKMRRIDTSWKDVSDGSLHTFLVQVTNTSDNPLNVYFARTQTIPAGWTTSLCWGSTCYGSTVDSAAAIINPGDSVVLTLDMTPALSDQPDSAKVWIRLGLVDSITVSDTMSIPYSASFKQGNPPLIFMWGNGTKFQYAFNGGGSHSIVNYLQNRSGVPTNYRFTIRDTMPAGWTKTFCVVTSHPSCATNDTVSYVFPDFPNGFYHNEGVFQEKLRIVFQAPTVVRKDSAVFHLSVRPETNNPLDFADYRFVGIVNTHTFTSDSILALQGGTANNFVYPFNNLCTIPKTYSFSLSAGTMAPGWTVSYCVGDSCVNSGDVRHAFDSLGMQNVTFRIMAPSVTQADTVLLRLTARDYDNPSDSTVYLFKAVALPANAVSEKGESNAGLAVTNAWPNPVYGASKLHLDILTDRDAPAAAVVYDMAGSSVATVDLGMLHRGANEIQLGSLTIPSGQYVVRIEQGSATSEIVKVNYIR